MKTNLQALRKAAGYKSAKAYAAHMGINYNTYTDYEQGRISLSLETAWMLADDLDCTLDELAGRSPARAALKMDRADERTVYAYLKLGKRDKAAVDAVVLSLASADGRAVPEGRVA